MSDVLLCLHVGCGVVVFVSVVLLCLHVGGGLSCVVVRARFVCTMHVSIVLAFPVLSVHVLDCVRRWVVDSFLFGVVVSRCNCSRAPRFVFAVSVTCAKLGVFCRRRLYFPFLCHCLVWVDLVGCAQCGC